MSLRDQVGEIYPDDVMIVLDDSEQELLIFEAVTESGYMLGMLQARIEELQYTIEGLYVDPDYRGMGIGTRLMDAFLSCLDDDIMMPCNMTFTEDEGGDSLVGFMQARNDFITTDAGMSYQTHAREFLTYKPIEAQIKKGFSPNVKELGQLDSLELKILLKNLKSVELGKYDTIDEFRHAYDPHLSTVCINEETLHAVILVDRLSDTELMIDVMYIKDRSIAALEVIAGTVMKVMAADPETLISIFTINEASEKIVNTLLENAGDVKKSRTYISNWLMIPNADLGDIMDEDSGEE